MSESLDDINDQVQQGTILPNSIRSNIDIMSLLGDDNPNFDMGCLIPIPKHRRQRQPWTNEDTKKLLKGVQIFGKGNWAIIHQQMQFDSTRSTTDLKDKWRNLIDPRKNARTPKDLKKLAELINREQGNAPIINRVFYGYIPQYRSDVQQLDCGNEAPPGRTPRILDISDSELDSHSWDSIQFNEEWEG